MNQLDKAYGYGSFRPGQLEAVNTILNGRDLVAVMRPAAAKASATSFPPCAPGTSRSWCLRYARLMRDQVQALQARGVAAA